jgi:hypothetical protein
MADVAGRLDRALRAAGVAIVGVSIGDPATKATWKVQPPTLQAQAQPTIDAFDPNAQSVIDAELTAAAVLTSREKDILAMCAVVVRAKGLAAWNAMTLQQKKDATFAEADVWRDMRVWAETNL